MESRGQSQKRPTWMANKELWNLSEALWARAAWFSLCCSLLVGCNQGKPWPGSGSSKSAETQPASGDAEGHSADQHPPGTMILDFKSGDPRRLTEIPDLSTKETSIREDLQKSFCLYV